MTDDVDSGYTVEVSRRAGTKRFSVLLLVLVMTLLVVLAAVFANLNFAINQESISMQVQRRN